MYDWLHEGHIKSIAQWALIGNNAPFYYVQKRILAEFIWKIFWLPDICTKRCEGASNHGPIVNVPL